MKIKYIAKYCFILCMSMISQIWVEYSHVESWKWGIVQRAASWFHFIFNFKYQKSFKKKTPWRRVQKIPWLQNVW